MTPRPNNEGRPPLAYYLLDRWMRLVAWLVPCEMREEWLTEWDGELWYGIAARPKAPWRMGVGLAIGLIRDALHMRRLDTPHHGLRRRSGAKWMSSIGADVRYSLRMLRKTPGFAFVVVITLALGIGATATIFSLVNSLLLSPLPYPDSDRLVILWQGRRGGNIDKDWFSGGQYSDIRAQTTAFEALAVIDGSSSTMTGRGRASQVGWVRASSTYLRMLGATAAVGRMLDEEDDRPDASPVAMLTHGLWQRSFGGDSSVVGQAITLDGNDIEVVGVLAPAVLLDTEVMPTMRGNGRLDLVLSFPPVGETLTDRLAEGYNIVGRLEPDVTLAQAQADLDLVAAGIQELHEGDPDSGFFIRVVPLIDEVVGSVRRGLLMLMASVGGVLLIACVNVANLLLARAGSRRRELGVRASLGAARGRLVQQLLTESAMLAAIGGLLGVGLAITSLSAVRRLGAASLPRLSEIEVDGQVLVFALAITAVTCLVFALLPAWRTSRVDVVGTLKPGGRGTVGGGALWSRFNLSSALVAAEIGLSLVLLVGGGLLARSFVALQRVDPGFQAESLLTFRVVLNGPKYAQPADRIAFYDQLTERLTALPGVEAGGATSRLPFDGGVSWGPIDIDDYVPPQGEAHEIIADFRVTSPGYFQAMGVPLIRGRVFDERDRLNETPTAVIDERFADTYFPDRDPIGMQLASFGGLKSTIVGVVGTVKHEALDSDSRVTTYVPQTQWGARGMYMALKTAGDPNALAAPAIRTVLELDNELAVVDVRPMRSRLLESLAERRFSMALLQMLSVVALILANVGIYGLVSYRVNQGTHELGLRMALGASRESTLSLVLRHGLALASTGVAAGLVTALALTGLIRSMLFSVSAFDLWTFATVSTGLVVTTLVACYVPARRATLANPLDAIKAD